MGFMNIIPSMASKGLTSDTTFSNYLLTVDAYSKILKLYGMEKITTEEVMYKLDMFQSRFGKIDKCGWWDLETISAYAGMQFTLREFREECQIRGFHFTLAAPEHQEMNGQVEVTRRTLCTVAHYIMVQARFSEAYINFALMYTTDHIFPVLPIKYLINEDGDPTTPHKLATGTKTLVSYLSVLFFPCVVRKSTAHIETKAVNMRHQAQKGFRGIFVGIPQHQKGYLVYLPSTRKMIFSYDVVLDESFSSALAYTSQPYSEAMAMRPEVTYTPCAKSPREQTGDVIVFRNVEEGNILTTTRNNAESGDESDDESIMTMDSGDESYHDLISTDMLEVIRDGSQTHMKFNRIEARYKIHDCIRQRQS